MKPATILFSVFTLVASAAAQTTGVAGFNDYTVNASTPGSLSCTTVDVPGGGIVEFNVDTAPNVGVYFLFTLNCPCSAGTFSFGSQPCPIPYTAMASTENQSLDLIIAPNNCPLITVPMASDFAGQATVSYWVPANAVLGTQAVVAHPCATAGIQLLFTQSYTLTT